MLDNIKGLLYIFRCNNDVVVILFQESLWLKDIIIFLMKNFILRYSQLNSVLMTPILLATSEAS